MQESQELFELLEIEGEGNQLAVPGTDRIGKNALIDIRQFVGMVLVKRVHQTVAELQFRDEFEERQVEVAADTYLEHRVVPFQLDEILRLAGQVHHWVDAANDIGAVIVETLGRELQVDGEGYIGVLHVLRSRDDASLGVSAVQVAERQVLGAKVHGRQQTDGEVLADTLVGQHTHAEARIPVVLVADDGLGGGSAVIKGDDLRANVLELNVLHVEAHADAKVHRAQVDVGLVLRFTLLGW